MARAYHASRGGVGVCIRGVGRGRRIDSLSTLIQDSRPEDAEAMSDMACDAEPGKALPARHHRESPQEPFAFGGPWGSLGLIVGLPTIVLYLWQSIAEHAGAPTEWADPSTGRLGEWAVRAAPR